ncbi:hypothetical protein MBH78_21635 [Oceanimonas sp. NS1]|nr:hypothetical protein [Oceanimonas sp. NS1]
MRQEWAHGADDVLWRRSKLGLRLTPEQQARLAAYMEQHETRDTYPRQGGGRCRVVQYR